MKLRIFFSLLIGVLIMACSSDDGDNGSNSIVGTWELTSIDLDGTSEEEEAAELLFNLLAAQDCSLITLIFQDGGQATLETSLAYLDFSGVVMGVPMIDCPTESDSENATYTYEDGRLTITDSEGFTTTIDVVLSGNRLTADLESFDAGDIGTSGTMTFERR